MNLRSMVTISWNYYQKGLIPHAQYRHYADILETVTGTLVTCGRVSGIPLE